MHYCHRRVVFVFLQSCRCAEEQYPYAVFNRQQVRLVNECVRARYHGMVEIGPCFGFGGPDVGFDLSTSHGYDFNPHIFVGGGMGLNLVPGLYNNYYYYNVYDEYLVKLYGEVRGYLLRSAVTPYLGLKLGPSFYTSSVDHGYVSAYLEASVGARWKFYRDYAVNLALSADTGWYYCGSLCVKVGFEF